MDGFAKRTEEKQQAILRAAFDLMTEKQSRFTISELAKRAHVSPVSIYNYFGSKDQVIVEILKQMTEEQMSWIEQAIESNAPFDALLVEILKRKIQTAVLFDETITAMIQQDPNWEHLATRGYTAFAQLIEYGKAQGSIDSTLSTSSYLRYVQFMQQAILSDPQFSIEDMKETMEVYFHFFLNGVMKR
ncbi:transcriptional regulator, TetR family [Exiguobacterium sp. AT1b]|uniref:Transcriptional regulator, TetR family n=1 Tax=Exiguobacterium sp. (strain ATCC BAA-1283 / AT1b) TaxID=360911 RepID=C4L1D3_EXISA|nr:TetR/AcrR family transcriptional regulator [Exiguobacterium sp. AT1b]ACQ69079.1 transcriptional regulator, TetR family [Exiguobacterium sp. AT1b]